MPAGSAFTAESDQYNVFAQLLRNLGAHIEPAAPVSFADISATPGPRVCVHPSFAILPTEIQARFPTPGQVFISPSSTLVIRGDVIIHSLSLDGALRLTAVPGTRLHVHAGGDADGSSSSGVTTLTTTAVVHNKGHVMKSLTELSEEGSAPTEVDKMRGYKIQVLEEEVVNTAALIDRVSLRSVSQALHNTESASGAAADIAVTSAATGENTASEAQSVSKPMSSTQDTDAATSTAISETEQSLSAAILPPTSAAAADHPTSSAVMSTATEALATLEDVASDIVIQSQELATSITHGVHDMVASTRGVHEAAAMMEFVYTGKALLPLSAYEPAAATATSDTTATTSTTAVGWPCFQLSLGPLKIC